MLVTYNPSPGKWGDLSKQRWMTEASSTYNYDPSMQIGIKFAESLHKFLTVSNVNAYVFWLGMCRGSTSEALIIENWSNELELPKVYYVFGQYTRFVREGYTRIQMRKSQTHCTLGVHYSFFAIDVQPHHGLQEKHFTCVIVNKNKHPITLNVEITLSDYTLDEKSLKAYETSNSSDWRTEKESPFVSADSILDISVGPEAVHTFVGVMVKISHGEMQKLQSSDNYQHADKKFNRLYM